MAVLKRSDKYTKNKKISSKECVLLWLFMLVCLVVQVLCTSDCNGIPCHKGNCNATGTNSCECYEGWAGVSCSYCSGRVR